MCSIDYWGECSIMIWKVRGTRRAWPNLKYSSGIFVQGVRKRQYLDRCSNLDLSNTKQKCCYHRAAYKQVLTKGSVFVGMTILNKRD
jgi:hypothetical protein